MSGVEVSGIVESDIEVSEIIFHNDVNCGL